MPGIAVLREGRMAIEYPEKRLAGMQHRFSRLRPVEVGDVCSSCGQDCDGEGFVSTHEGSRHYAVRVWDKPFCARGKCYYALWKAFSGG